MKLTYKKVSLFAIAGVAYLVGQYFRGVWFLGSAIPNVCGHAEAGGIPFCNSPFIDTLGWPLIILGQSLAIAAIILVFANARAWHAWVRFSIWFVPISALVIISVFPVPFVPGFELSRANATYLFGNLYAIITALIVGISWIRIWFKRRSLL